MQDIKLITSLWRLKTFLIRAVMVRWRLIASSRNEVSMEY